MLLSIWKVLRNSLSLKTRESRSFMLTQRPKNAYRSFVQLFLSIDALYIFSADETKCTQLVSFHPYSHTRRSHSFAMRRAAFSTVRSHMPTSPCPKCSCAKRKLFFWSIHADGSSWSFSILFFSTIQQQKNKSFKWCDEWTAVELNDIGGIPTHRS